MYQKPPRRWCLICGSLLWFLTQGPRSASAEPTPQSTSAESAASEYDTAIREAVDAYEAGRFAEARTSFRQAHEIMPTARTLRIIGMCSFNLGDYADAVANLEAALKDTRKPLTDEQRTHVTGLLAQANTRVGRFRLRLSPQETHLDVDGRKDVDIQGGELVLDAGQHDIAAHADGYQTANSKLNVQGSDRTTLVFNLKHETATTPSTPAPVAAVAVPQPPVVPHEKPSNTLRNLGYVSLGLGAASLIGFGVTGALALSDKSSLDDKCPSRTCPANVQSDVDSYDTLKTISTITLISGGVFTALGAVLLIAQPSKPETRAERETPRKSRAQATITPYIAPFAIGVRGHL